MKFVLITKAWGKVKSKLKTWKLTPKKTFEVIYSLSVTN